jgi:hypothetical protein
VADTGNNRVQIYGISAYSPATTLTNTGGGGALYLTDYNNDGFQDIAAANFAGTNINIFLGKGDGTFQPAISFPVGHNPSSLAMGDFDGNGKRDLAVPNQSDDTVTILLGTGSHSWWNFTSNFNVSLTSGSSPRSAVCTNPGDAFNQKVNPNQDLILASFGIDSITVLFGDGTGHFPVKTDFPLGAGYGPKYAHYGHYSSGNSTNGNLDIITANFAANSVTTQIDTPVGGGPICVVPGDFDGDGLLDAAVLCNTDKTIKILKGDGSGHFTLIGTYAVGNDPRSIFAYAATVVGTLDLFVANDADNTVSVLKGNNNGTFQTALSYGVGVSPAAVAVRNFNTDSKPDIVTSGAAGISILMDNYANAIRISNATAVENSANNPITLTGITYTGPLTFIITALPPVGVLMDGSTPITVASLPYTLSGSVVNYTPAANYVGTDTFYFVATDGFTTSDPAYVTVTVLLKNHAPTFTQTVFNDTVSENAALRNVTMVTAMSPGPANEANQTLNFIVLTDDNSALFSTAPSITRAGVLQFRPAVNATGTAHITFVLKDTGGTANGGSDTSATAGFAINVTHVNQPPYIGAIGSQTVLENGSVAFDVPVTDIDTAPGQITMVATATSNSGVVPIIGITAVNAGPAAGNTTTFHVTIMPAPNNFGSATIQLTASDHESVTTPLNATTNRSFGVTVTFVNQAPSFARGPDQFVATNSGAATVSSWATTLNKGAAAESSQVLTFHVSAIPSFLFSAQPAINNATGALAFTPALNATGSASVSVYLTDNGGTANGGQDTSATQTFVIKVRPWASSDLMVADSSTIAGHGGLIDVRTNTGVQTVLVSSTAGFRPNAVAQFPSGDLAIVDATNKKVSRLDQYSLASTTLFSGGSLTAPFDLVSDTLTNVYLIDGSNVYQLQAQEYYSTLHLLATGGAVTGIAIAPNNDLYLAETTAGAPSVTTLTAASGYASGFTLYSPGVNGVVPSDLAFQIAAPYYPYLVNAQASAANLIQLNGSSNPNVLAGKPFIDPQAVCYESLSGDFFVTEFGSGSATVFTDRKIYRVHVANATASPVSIGGAFDKPSGIIVVK